MKLYIKFLFYFLISPIGLFGQINQQFSTPDISPHNPQVYQFMKYGEIPIDSYTGTPDISIPLYTLNTKAFDIPISLTYHSNGLKVNEEASWVGLGWNLNTDMEIVQTVIGLDDFGLYKNRSLLDFECTIGLQSGGLSGSSILNLCNSFYLAHDDNWNQNNPSCFINPAFAAGTKDTEPDIFYFSALGYSGKFALDWNTNNFVCLNDANIKIEAPNYNPSGIDPVQEFIITVPDGHKFYFMLKDSTKINVSQTSHEYGGGIPSTILEGQISGRVFKLITLVSSQSDMITFEYEKVHGENSTTELNSKNFPNINITQRTYVANSTSGSSYIPATSGNLISFFATQQSYSYLSKINYRDLSIKFITSSRIDLKEAKKLDKIEVLYKNHIEKNIIFNYDYFVANSNGNNWDQLLNFDSYNCEKTSDELSKRLKLVSVKKGGSNLQLFENPFLFSYDEQSLPKKTSYALDYWGFYNGSHNNLSFLPDIYKFNIQRENTFFSGNKGNNNSSVLNFCKASILNKVTYPTGGFTEYEYELNTFDNYPVPPPSQGALKPVSVNAINGNSSHQIVISKGGGTIFNGSYILSTRGCNFSQVYANTYIKITKFKPSLIPIIENNSYGVEYAMAIMGLLNGSNQTNYNLYFDSVQYIQMQVNGPIEQLNNNYKLALGEGVILFTAVGGCPTYNGTVNSSLASITLSYNEYLPLNGPYFGSGLRIKSIKNYSKPNKLELVKRYSYEGGKLMSPLLYFNKTMSNHQNQIFISSNCQDVGSYNEDFQSLLSILLSNMSPYLTVTINDLVRYFKSEADIKGCALHSIAQGFNGWKYEIQSGNYIQPSATASGKFVGYDKVTETLSSNNNVLENNGKIVNFYKNTPDIGAYINEGGGYFTEINLPLTVSFPENGFLYQNEIRNNQNELLQKTINTPTFVNGTCLWGMKVHPTDTYLEYPPGWPVAYIESKYLVGVYPNKSGKTLLKEQEITEYDGTNELVTKKQFFYDTRNQVSKEAYSESNGDNIEKYFYYPYDVSETASSAMLSRNLISPVVKQRTLVNGNPISLIKSQYNYVPQGTGAFVIEKEQYAKSGAEEDLEDINIYTYDQYGNIQSMKRPDGLETFFIWGYQGTLLVAKIENGSISTVPPNLVVSIQNTSSNGTNAQLEALLTSLRNHPAMEESLVTTYTHKPLYGIFTVTDPKGLKTSFSYDALGRMTESRDSNNNLISRNVYNQRPQN